MNKPTYFIGVDVSKRTLDLAVSLGHELLFHFKVSNTLSGIEKLMSQLDSKDIGPELCIFCIEFTGIYSSLVATTLVENQFKVWMESGARIKASKGLERGKNDKIDAIRISQYAFRFIDQCSLWEPIDQNIDAIKRLLTNRNRLVKAKNMLKVPLKELEGNISDKELHILQKINKNAIETIKKQIKAVEKSISSLIKSDQKLAHLYKLVTSVRGIGPIAAWYIISATNSFKKISTAKKFACYSGVAPFEHESGTSIKGRSRVSHLANKNCKKILHLAALSAISHPCEYRTYFDRKVKEGKHKLSVLNAIRNKIIQRVFACVRDNREYEDSYQHSFV